MNALPLFRIGTRGSPLALAQARMVERRLAACHPALAQTGATDIVAIRTSGDRIQDRTLAEIGGKGLFTREIDEALAEARIDIAVHSCKDMPTRLQDGFVLAAVLEREDCRDAFLSSKAACLADLPSGAVVGTASLRRAAQILNHRPDLVVRPLRGNIETRLTRLHDGVIDATLLAMAGLNRLGLAHVAASALSTEEMLPAVAQGAIGIVCREADAETRALLAPLDHAETHCAVDAERAFLAVLDGSCRTPIAGLAEIHGDRMRFRGLILSPDGREAHAIDTEGCAAEAAALGRDAGETLRDRCPPGFRIADMPENSP